jgi:3-methyladenine DNA glycosylase/8-oxoguanine DNA glycosylase
MAEKTLNEATLKLVNVMRAANQAMANSLVAAQERNVKYAQSILTNGLEVFNSQVVATRDLTQQLLGLSQRQQDAFQALAQEAVDRYIELLRIPLTSYKEAIEFAESRG